VFVSFCGSGLAITMGALKYSTHDVSPDIV